MRLILSFFFLNILMISCQEAESISDAFGNFEATPTLISSEANGRLIFLNIEEGNILQEGKLIGLVDTTSLHLQKLKVKANIGTLPKKLQNTLADIEVLKKEKTNLVRERDRVKRLVEKKAATPKQLDDLNGSITVIDGKIAAIKSQTAISNKAILAEKEPLIAQLNILEEQIAKCYVTNPIEGTVLVQLAEPHEIVNVGSPLYQIADLNQMDLKFYVDAIQLQNLQLNENVKILIDKDEDGYRELNGRITWISSQAEFTPKVIQTKKERTNLVYAVKARVDNTEGLIKIGMPAEVVLKTSNN